jgi:Leucine-rich repeat (LRR) protein
MAPQHLRDIPADVVQNAAEYIGSVVNFLQLRGVSRAWNGAISDAVGYLNNKCWTELIDGFELDEDDFWRALDDPRVDPLPKHFQCDTEGAALRCAALCLRSRLRTLSWTRSSVAHFTLSLLGTSNTTLASLRLSMTRVNPTQLRGLQGLRTLQLLGSYLDAPDLAVLGELKHLRSLDLTHQPVTDLTGLRNCSELRELSLRGTRVTDDSFIGLETILSQLIKLDLSHCKSVTVVSMLAPCANLRDLNLQYSGAADLNRLDQLVALEALNLENVPLRDWKFLQRLGGSQLQRLRLRFHGLWQADISYFATSAAGCLVSFDVSNCSIHDVSCLRSCIALRELILECTGVTSETMQSLAELPVLEVLNLRCTKVRDATSLARCQVLKDLNLSDTRALNDVAGLECIPTLERLNLDGCRFLNTVTTLRHCRALRKLVLSDTQVTDEGLAGIEGIPTLTALNLARCDRVTSVCALRHCVALRNLNLSSTRVTTAGIEGLEQIPTLVYLRVDNCQRLRSVALLRSSPSLRYVNVSGCQLATAEAYLERRGWLLWGVVSRVRAA